MSAPSPLAGVPGVPGVPGVAPLAPSQWKNPNPMSSYINPATGDLYHNDAPGPGNRISLSPEQLDAMAPSR